MDADIFIDNQKRGKGKLEIELPTMSHELLVKKEGYAPFMRKILPRLNYPQNIDVNLLTEDEFRLRGIQSSLTNSQGQVLRRIEAGKFMMGASRREMGRRANEVIRNVELTKPFFIGIKEVTNKEFSRFRRLNLTAADIHPSLLADNNPVILVSWSDAVEYCNWLSNQEGLEPVYIKRFEKWERKKPTPNGYRLPSEAEWSWSIRYQAKNAAAAFPWGNRLPPRRNYANLADSSAKNILPNIIQNYEDGYASTSPVGTFRANLLGIFDGSGNVSEWISDYYSIPTPGITEIVIDPNGPESGVQHVIRGSSWRHSNVTQLRGSFRDFGSEGQVDIGFRLARNIN
jgi:formylglycine-generating enzyme required for sulfatase activity